MQTPPKSSATLHFTCGKMASGKTTLSKRLALETGAVIVSWDLWLQRLFPVEIVSFADFLKYSDRLKVALSPHIRDLLSMGVSVVLDYPANIPAARRWVRTLYEPVGADHVLHFVDTPNERCIAQLHQRNAEAPEGSVTMTNEQFAELTALFEPPTPEEGFRIEIHR